MKKIISAAFGVGLLLTSVSPAFAGTSVSMTDTGPYSWNIGAVLKLKRTDVHNTQTARVTNNVNSRANSGKNEILNNTKVLGDTGTGNATSDVAVENYLNDSSIEVNGCGCPEGDTTITLDQTGPYSKNIAVIVDAQSTTVTNNQNANVVNNVTSKANSGRNKIEGNTKVEGVGTGDATSYTYVGTFANNSVIVVNP